MQVKGQRSGIFRSGNRTGGDQDGKKEGKESARVANT